MDGFIYSDNYPTSCEIPLSVARCPCCGSSLIAEFDEWDIHTLEPNWDCSKVDCSRPGCFEEYQDSEYWRMPYVYWLPLEVASQRWMEQLWREQQES